MVARVKAYKAGFVVSDSNISPDGTLADIVAMDLLKGLNGAQREAVTATEGFIRVVAGAGSGKTRALTHRFAYLVNEIGVLPSNILCVTFTNKSANEMRQRIHNLTGDNDTGYINTFHGFCVSVLQEDSNAVQYPKSFLVLDNSDIDAMSDPVCGGCFHRCVLAEGQTGLCRARRCEGGRIVSLSYGRLTALALDPIEKKPLALFYPGTQILSAGSFGCNLRCPFCQNHEISMAGKEIKTTSFPSELLIQQAIAAREMGNIGIAFTYNEPLISYEYIKDCAGLARKAGLRVVLVTNGMLQICMPRRSSAFFNVSKSLGYLHPPSLPL